LLGGRAKRSQAGVHDEFKRFPLKDPGITARNFPYFEMLEVGQDGMVDSVVVRVAGELIERLPKGLVCSGDLRQRKHFRVGSPRDYFGWDMKPTLCTAACRLGKIITERE